MGVAMKLLRQLFFLAFTFMIMGNAEAIVIPDESIRAGSERYHANGLIERVYLKTPLEINGVLWKGWTWLDDHGLLRHSVLAHAHTFSEITLPEGTTVFFENGSELDFAYLAHDMTIQDLPIDGGGKTETGFFPDGRLRYCFLTDHVTIQGIPCRGGAFTVVRFDENGKLIQCTLKEDHLIDGTVYPVGSEIWFNADGSLQRVKEYGWFARAGRDLLDLIF